MNAGRRFRPAPLALSRIARFWREIWKCWRLTLDWTVQLYIVLPGLFVGANLYRDVWLNPPAWLDYANVQAVFAVLGMFMLRARVRTFAYEGDGLFLRRSGRWTKNMLHIGFGYTLLVRMLTAAAVLALLAPVLDLKFGWNLAIAFQAGLAAAFFGYAWTMARDGLERRLSGWRRPVALWGARIAFIFVWTAGMTAAVAHPVGLASAVFLLFIVSLLLALLRLRAKGTFAHELTVEGEAYSACIRFLFYDSGGLPKLPRRRKPLLSFLRLRLPGPRDTDRRAAELWLKAKLRDADNLQALLLFAVLGCAAVALSPVGLGLAVWPLIGLVALLWFRGQWHRWEAERFVAMLTWANGSLERAETIGVRAMFMPLFLLWGTALGCKIGLSFGGLYWIAVWIVPLIGWPAGWRGASWIIAGLRNRERKRREEDGKRREEEARHREA